MLDPEYGKHDADTALDNGFAIMDAVIPDIAYTANIAGETVATADTDCNFVEPIAIIDDEPPLQLIGTRMGISPAHAEMIERGTTETGGARANNLLVWKDES